MKIAQEELQRKCLHIFFGALIPAGIFYLPWIVSRASTNPPPPGASWYAAVILGCTLLIHLVAEALRFHSPRIQKIFFRFFGTMLRRGESSRITGSTWINASSFLCAVLFSTHPHIALVVLNAFIWGDAVAALVGIQFGKTKIGDKSLEGSIACLSLCLVLFFFVYPHLPLMPPQWSGFIPLPLTIAASLCITLMELFPVRIKNVEINDNLTVPVVTGVLLVIGEKLIGL